MKLRILDLFSGIGGFSLGLERTGGFETVAFCEYEDFPRRVLAKHWPEVPCFPDVRELKGSDIDGPIDVICGGYPCQPFSTAGKRQGAEDDRHLWPEFDRLVDELRPTWVIGENVAGHVSMGLDSVLSDLEAKGYTPRPFIIPACAANLPHRRDRCWIVAHAPDMQRNGEQHHGKPDAGQVSQSAAGSGARAMAHAKRNNEQGIITGVIDQEERAQPHKRQAGSCCDGAGQRRFEPSMGRVDDGFPPRLDEPRDRVTVGTKDRAARLKALGNAVTPRIPEMIGHAILEAEAGL